MCADVFIAMNLLIIILFILIFIMAVKYVLLGIYKCGARVLTEITSNGK